MTALPSSFFCISTPLLLLGQDYNGHLVLAVHQCLGNTHDVLLANLLQSGEVVLLHVYAVAIITLQV